MNRRLLTLALPAVVAATAGAYALGGWASITLDELPDAFIVGKPTQLSFMVRQHGVTPLENITPTIDARSADGGGTVQAVAQPGKTGGQYVATLTIPRAGEWRVDVKSGFGRSDLSLLPMPSIAAGAPIPALADADRGRRLFAAKGCVNCHVHSALDSKPLVETGPNLSEKRFDAAYLAMWLANPAIRPPTNGGQPMPNLGLSQREIASLVAFVNGGRVTANR